MAILKMNHIIKNQLNNINILKQQSMLKRKNKKINIAQLNTDIEKKNILKLNDISFNDINPNYSINTILITTDNKILIGLRTKSFYLDFILKKKEKNINTLQKCLDNLLPNEIDEFKLNNYDFKCDNKEEIVELTINNDIKTFSHKKKNNFFILPGGKKSKTDKNIEDTLRREISEELGFSNFQIFKKGYNVYYIKIYDKILERYFIDYTFIYRININSEDALKQFKKNKEIQKIIFLDHNDISKYLNQISQAFNIEINDYLYDFLNSNKKILKKDKNLIKFEELLIISIMLILYI